MLPQKFKIIFRKEVKDILRDKRSMMAFLYAVVGTPLFIGLIFTVISLLDDNDPTKLLVTNPENAPGLVSFVEKNGIIIEAYEEDSEAVPSEIPEGYHGIVVLPENFEGNVSKGITASLTLFTDQSGSRAIRRVREIEGALRSYSSYIATVRLTARGVPVGLVQPMQITSIDISTENFLSGFMSEMVLLMVLVAPFMAGMSVAIDALAGERERGSLQPLLAQPISAGMLTMGKWAPVFCFAFVGTVVQFTLLVVGMQFMPPGVIALTPRTDPLTLSLIFVQLVFLAMFASSLQIFLSIQAKSFKEAQTYLGMVLGLPVMLMYVKILISDRIPDAVLYLPLLADMESISSLLFHGNLSPLHYLVALGVSLCGVSAMLFLTQRKLASERLLEG